MLKRLIKNTPFLYKLGLTIKHHRWNINTKNAFQEYLQNYTAAKLQVGAGTNNLTGWFNTDYFARPDIHFLDVTKTFLFPDNLFELVFSEHHIEHITYQQAQKMLSEAYRVMKPGGYIKITTPDLAKYIQAYAGKTILSPIIEQHVKDWVYSGFAYAATYIPVDNNYEAHFINDIFYNYEHRFIYDASALNALLKNAGFNVIDDPQARITAFAGTETHTNDFDQNFTLYIYAKKQ